MSLGISALGWAAIAAAGVTAGGTMAAANSSAKAQAGANNANRAAIDSQNQAALDNWTAGRGWNPGSLGFGNAGDALNTSLPLWSTINGTPSEQYLLNSILGGLQNNPNDITAYASVSQIEKFFQTPQGQQTLQEITDSMAGSDDQRSPAQWLADHIQTTEKGNGTFSTLLKNFANAPAGTDGSLVNPAATAPTAITDMQNAATQNAAGVFNGAIRDEELAALQPVLNANTDLAALQIMRNGEQRSGSLNVYGTEMRGLQDLLAARQSGVGSIYDDAVRVAGDVYGARGSAAEQLYGAQSQAARDVYGARRAGTEDIYGADLKYADTYSDATKQALQRVLAQQTAKNAIKGFEGASSGDALLKARTLAGGYQQSAGVRANAGQNRAISLAKAGEAQAMDLGTASTTRAGSLGQAGISKAQDLGTASQKKFTSLAGAGEQDAIGRMNAAVANATRQASILDADAAIAQQQATLTNATARAGVTSNDITRRLASGNLPAQTYNNQLGITTAATNSQYAPLDAVLNRLGMFRSGNSTPPTPQAFQTQPNVNSGQIWGSALGSVASGVGQAYSNQQLINALNKPTTTGTTTFGGQYGATPTNLGGLTGNYD